MGGHRPPAMKKEEKLRQNRGIIGFLHAASRLAGFWSLRPSHEGPPACLFLLAAAATGVERESTPHAAYHRPHGNARRAGRPVAFAASPRTFFSSKTFDF